MDSCGFSLSSYETARAHNDVPRKGMIYYIMYTNLYNPNVDGITIYSFYLDPGELRVSRTICVDELSVVL